MSVSLRQLLKNAKYGYDVPDTDVCGICYSSLKAEANFIFFAVIGADSDGHNYVNDAYIRGARVFFVCREVSLPDDAVIIRVDDTRKALADISASFYGYPQNKLKTIGVTGTKGKSTVVELIRAILNYSGRKCASVGTLGFYCDGEHIETVNSTPQSADLFGYLKKAADSGCGYAVIEASSQGIKQSRIRGIHFDYAVFTNLSYDHIGKGEHENFEDYKSSKIGLFKMCDTAVINADDEFSNEFAIAPKNIFYSIDKNSEISAGNIVSSHTESGFKTRCTVKINGGNYEIEFSIPGKAAVYDVLAAAAVCIDIGIDIETIANAIKYITVPGRFELIKSAKGIDCIVDYAHNGASMENALLTLRQCGYNRIISVFGSVGGRSRLRRCELAKAVDKYADYAIITSDNPDRENAQSICDEIAQYILSKPYKIIPDRAEAIEYALSSAVYGDAVLLAGKGHECYQLINGIKQPFNEKDLLLK